MWENFKGFFARPYKGAAEMDTLDWFFWTGFVLVLIILWGMIFNHIKEGLST